MFCLFNVYFSDSSSCVPGPCQYKVNCWWAQSRSVAGCWKLGDVFGLLFLLFVSFVLFQPLYARIFEFLVCPSLSLASYYCSFPQNALGLQYATPHTSTWFRSAPLPRPGSNTTSFRSLLWDILTFIIFSSLLLPVVLLIAYLSSCACVRLQGIFPTQESNPCLLHWQEDSLPPSHLGSPVLALSSFNSKDSDSTWQSAGHKVGLIQNG